MKPLFLFLLLSLQSHAYTHENNITKSCVDIIQEIATLKKERSCRTSSKAATFLLGGGYVVGMSNQEMDMKIKVLEYQLSDCQ